MPEGGKPGRGTETADREARFAREAAALRANLGRRKAQNRARARPVAVPDRPADPVGDGEGGDGAAGP